MLYAWLIAIVLFVIVEIATTQLVTIWFAVGAVAGLVLELMHVPAVWQLVGFVVASGIALICTRPLVKKLTKKNFAPTNADRCIGKVAEVVEDIDNIREQGAVKINGVVWSARSVDGKCISKNELVKIIRIDGVKLIVDKE